MSKSYNDWPRTIEDRLQLAESDTDYQLSSKIRSENQDKTHFEKPFISAGSKIIGFESWA